MGKLTRSRWKANVKSMEIVSKPKEDITHEDIKFLRENYTSMGGLLPKGFNGGAFFTPTHVAKFIVEFLDIPNMPKGTRILEPSVGSGVFLEHVPISHEITAIELDETSGKVTSIIYPHANVIIGNALEHERENYYDFVIGNPPYGEIVETKREFKTLSNRKGVFRGKSEFAFIELAIRACKYGGYIAFILPMGLSFNSNARKTRKLIYETCWQIATIELPQETFQHVGTSIPTQILILRKVPPNAKMIYAHKSLPKTKFFEGQQPAFFARVGDIGYDKKGKPTNKWGDGLTQLDELLELVRLNGWQTKLVRENEFPYKPWWANSGNSVTEYMFSKSADTREKDFASEGFIQESRYLSKNEVETGLVYWHEMTLGVGEGRSWDFDWQNEIVENYYYTA